jgi:tetratricopeptide (TPR) repeat protein
MRLLLTAVIAANCFAQSSDFRTWMNEGVAAFKDGRYDQAIDAFRHAVDLNPDSSNAQLYLGTVYMATWIPGAESADNKTAAANADSAFRRVLQIEPQSTTALASLATLAYNAGANLPGDTKVQKLHEARDWYRKLLLIDPQNKEAFYSLGVIAWSEWYPADMAARATLQGWPPSRPGPLPTPLREQLKTGFAALIEDGIAQFQTALTIDPEYDDAMAYLNLLYRERADIRDSADEANADIALADQLVAQTLATKKAKAAAHPQN